jgi:hypothetical protein
MVCFLRSTDSSEKSAIIFTLPHFVSTVAGSSHGTITMKTRAGVFKPYKDELVYGRSARRYFILGYHPSS